MGWIATIADRARARDGLSGAEVNVAVRAFRENGCLVLRNALDPALLQALHTEWTARYEALDAKAMRIRSGSRDATAFMEVGHRRFEIAPRMSGVFADPELFANAVLLSVLGPLLGEDMRLNSFTCVISFPGAEQQHIHRDHGHLFEEVGPSLPVYAVNIAIPLVDVDLEMGPTGVWPGSHLELETNESVDAVTTALRLGDVMLLDYRTVHTGLPNRSSRARPILYLVFARPWFFDEQNHLKRAAVDMPLEIYDTLPPSAKKLMSRALAREMRNRHGDDPHPVRLYAEAEEPGRVPPTVGEPCPCGNGKAFRSCHGQA